MAGFLTHLLEGSNLAEYDAFARDGDIAHLGVIGRNNTLINSFEREAAVRARYQAEADAETAARRSVQDAETRERWARQEAEERRRDHLDALDLNRASRLPKAERVKILRDSNEAVDDFLLNIR